MAVGSLPYPWLYVRIGIPPVKCGREVHVCTSGLEVKSRKGQPITAIPAGIVGPTQTKDMVI